MLVATFGPTTGWAGKTITYEDEQFVLEGHGPVAPSAIVDYDRQGHLEWMSEGLKLWVHEQASALAPPAPPPTDAQSPSPEASLAQPTGEESPNVAGGASSGSSGAPPVATLNEDSGLPPATSLDDHDVVAMEGAGAVAEAPASPAASSALSVPYDGSAADDGPGAAPPAPASVAPEIDPATLRWLSKAQHQVEGRRFKGAVETLWFLDAIARQGDNDAAQGIIALTEKLGPQLDGKLARECADLAMRARQALAKGDTPEVGRPAHRSWLGQIGVWLQIAALVPLGLLGPFSALPLGIGGFTCCIVDFVQARRSGEQPNFSAKLGIFMGVWGSIATIVYVARHLG